MAFENPGDVRRTFERSSEALARRKSGAAKLGKKSKKSNFWPRGKIDYDFLEKCKEVVCRVKHPTAMYKYKDIEYRVSIMNWSRGSYLDVRQYKKGKPTGAGILLHLDIINAILPEINAAVRRMDNEDSREPENKSKPEVIIT